MQTETVQTKLCYKCGKEKPFSDFGKDRRRKFGLTSACKACRNPQAKAWRDKNREYVKIINARSREKRKDYYSDPQRKIKYRSIELLRKFGLSHADYENILAKQNGVCLICQRYRVASNKYHMTIDHCHKTNKIRGILCTWCNKAIGLFEDNLELLERAKKYLLGELS